MTSEQKRELETQQLEDKNDIKLEREVEERAKKIDEFKFKFYHIIN